MKVTGFESCLGHNFVRSSRVLILQSVVEKMQRLNFHNVCENLLDFARPLIDEYKLNFAFLY